MIRKFTDVLLLLLLAVFLNAGPIPQRSETESTVPELAAFHEVIYPIWHTAYPEKDYAALRGYVSDINAHWAKIEAAKLPGILRDKQAAWAKGLAELKQAVVEYTAAAQGSDNQKLLAAAEQLHARFEMMVRTIRPVLKEVDAFHKLLYVVYHQCLPEKKYEEIRSLTTEMTAKAEAIVQAQLPKRLEGRTPQFKAAAERLLTESKGLAEACKADKGESIEKAVQSVHTAYQDLEKIFE